MFNNKFLKNDPLLEAVKTAQADGATRRAAIAMVNEEFGVYSRNAVIRENLAAYDARIEETYKALKEGNKEEKADKDYDRDGKIESGKAEYQGSRIRAAKLAGKLKEEEQIDEVSKSLARRYKKAAQADLKQQKNSPVGRGNWWEQGDTDDPENRRKEGIKRANKIIAKEETDYSAQDLSLIHI